MHISFTSHNTTKSTSSFGLIDYLDKENQAYVSLESENGNKENLTLEKDHEFESFFDGDYSEENSSQQIDIHKVVSDIDCNRGTQNLKQSNFYMFNVSPNKSELAHMEQLANTELQNRGLIIDSKNKLLEQVYQEQKNELMKMQMKLYAKDLMTEYARNFKRDIYADESKLPDKNQRKELENSTEKEFKSYLSTKGIEQEDKKNQDKSSKWIDTNNLVILEEKGNSIKAELTIEGNLKSEVFLPKKLVQEQENGSYKLPENLYNAKANEIINKNTLVEINASFKDTKSLKNKEEAYNFEKTDSRLENPLKMSFNESDITKTNNKYYVSKHLYDEKEKQSLKQSILSEYGTEREKIYNKLARERGFNLEKRPLTEKDLLWYGKVETQRTHKPTDLYVIKNQETLKEIERLSKNKIFNQNKIANLESSLFRDEKDNIIKAGLKKEGNQYHVHLVVSRHDKTMQKPENKISLSPLANHKEGKMYKGADVGFNRDAFFQKAETVFDKKFDYDRTHKESYQGYKEEKKQRSMSNNVVGKTKGELKSFVKKHTGINTIKQQISPVQNIKTQLGMSQIPSRIPKTPLDLAFKIGKKVIDKGLGY
ncbi:hypothetical protein EV196_11325 [Mariniflexile fucanivorans]|uniref:Uncharacterized protein n=1 Tax=Mariniflexile fucanivorans TaxID=264023 RepID=A0A4R1R9S6_9FLAO|nr:DUF5712 family protein [Mariniflexile fucanivorans]TCL62484.1 hypothetical protein EV196_11325 [Mariniflexile fucanivorans]